MTQEKQLPPKPLPLIDEDSVHYFKMAREHKFPLYNCTSCGAWYFPITECFKCDKPSMELTPASGKGTLYSFGVYHQQYHPAWVEDIPYAVALVRTEEGPFVFGNVVGDDIDGLQLGMAMNAVFDDVQDDAAVIRWTPA